MSYNSRNYAAQGGAEWVVGGKLTFLPGVPASEATTIAALRDDLNALLTALKTAGLMIDESAASRDGA